MPTLGPTEILIIAIVVLVLFGAKKMPDAARSLGRSMRIFKAETKTLRDDDDDKSSAEHHSQQSSSEQAGQGSSSAAQPQPLSSAQKDEPVVDGKVVSREQAEQSR